MDLLTYLGARAWALFRAVVMAGPVLIGLICVKLQLVFICARARRTLRRYA